MTKISTLYNPLEVMYAEPFANALAENPAFQSWVLGKAGFGDISGGSKLLFEEMRKKRSKTAQTWWGSHYANKCKCLGCNGQETDLLVVFENLDGLRFAVHFEVKRPGDTFGKNQAANYSIRAACWAKNAPAKVVSHSLAVTALLCSKMQLQSFAAYLGYFDSVITFEDVDVHFPGWRSGYA